MKTPKKIATFLTASLVAGSAWAQIPGANIPPRADDHFQRNLVVNRIDLDEKMNQPIVSTEDPALYGQRSFGETEGLVVALLNGLKSGKYLAYSADSLNKSLTYEDVTVMGQRMNGVDEPFEEDPFFDIDEDPTSDYDYSEVMMDESGGEEGDFDFGSGDKGNGTPFAFEVAPLETAVEFIENRIFDKNRSSQIYDIQYIRLVWVDPGETLPDKNFICLKYSDVLETLEDTQWKNKFNDAEYRNLREVFELRMFNSYITYVSGRGVRTLPESDFRRNQLLDFEHHLWSY